MLFIGCFEGSDSQRGITWRCADSRSLREFLGQPDGYHPGPQLNDGDSSAVARERV